MTEINCPECGRPADNAGKPRRFVCQHKMCGLVFDGPLRLQTFAEYHREVKRTKMGPAQAERSYLRACNGLGIAGEGGEVLEAVADFVQVVWDGVKLGIACGKVADSVKKAVFHGKQGMRKRILKELGDVAWYSDALAEDFDSSLAEVATMNAEKTAARYPNGYTPEDANKPRPEDKEG